MKSPFVQALVVAPVIYLLSAISVLFVMMNVIDPSTPGHRAGVSAVAFWAVLPSFVAIVFSGLAYLLYRGFVVSRRSPAALMLNFLVVGLISASLVPYILDSSLGNLTLPLNLAVAFCFGVCFCTELWLVGFCNVQRAIN